MTIPNLKAEDWIFLALLVFFSYSDLKSRVIEDWIWIPMIAFAIWNHRVIDTTIFFIMAVLVGMYDWEQKRFLTDYDQRALANGRTLTLYRGGDIKLMALAAASGQGLAVGVSWVFVSLYRVFRRGEGALPYAPFLLASTITIFLLALLWPVKIL